ncbi:ent-kaurene oxidase [Coniochaeta sp. 2T2.1]|nr:ent-kaurene oxidase [Coniochaeta sp. 2T2.1]
MASKVTKITELVADRMPLIATAVLVSLLAIIVQRLFTKDPLSGIPFAGLALGDEEKRRKAYLEGAGKIYMEGYEKFRNRLFRVTNPRSTPIIVVPSAFLPELRNLPDDVLSFPEAVTETLQTKYTGLLIDVPTAIHTIKTKLTPGLVRLNPIIAEEVSNTIRLELPPCTDWTEVNISSKLNRIVAQVSGRLFLGSELCHDEAYINAAINYTVDLIGAVPVIERIPAWRRWLTAWSVAEVKRVQKHQEEATRFLRPIIAARRRAALEQPGYQKPDDMLQWLLDDHVGLDDRWMAKIQLMVSFAAIHTTSTTATNAFYNLAAHQELIPELRQEIQSVLTEHDNQFSSAALQKMKKLDSFLKETIRCHPNGLTSFTRKVLRPFTLSNGETVPPNVTIEVPLHAIYNDPTIFPDPERFDGLRFYRAREEQGAKLHNQFVSVHHETSLSFGYGRHACPGRFFAANEIKMIVARMVLGYDIKNVGVGEGERYDNFWVGNGCFPDPSKNLLFREV